MMKYEKQKGEKSETKENCCDKHKMSCKTTIRKKEAKVHSGVTFEVQCIKLPSMVVIWFIFVEGYSKVRAN